MSLRNRQRAGSRDEGGFTLIELLVVIIILGILSAVVVFAVRGAGDKGKAAAFETDSKTIRTAEEAFCARFGRYGEMNELVTPPGGGGGFLSEPSKLQQVHTGTGGPCKGLGNTQSAFAITCDAASAQGCGAGGAVALGGTMVINNGASAPAASLNPAINSAGGIHSNSEDMFNGLLRYELDGSIGGDLAQTFNFNNAVPSGTNPNCTGVGVTCDPTTTVATFVLRKGVKFHGAIGTTPLGDGATLTADDVFFSFSRAILAAHGRTRAMNTPLGVTGANFTTVVPPNAIQTVAAGPNDGGTVIFNFRQVFAPLKYTLNVTEAPILSRAAYDPCWTAGTLFSVSPPNACPTNTSPVGTGPFRFKSLDGTGIRTVKNVDYFRKDAFGVTLPYLDELYKKVVAGNSATSIQSGAVDVASISNVDRPTVATDPNVVLSATPRGSGGGNCITTASFNTTKREAGALTVAPAAPAGGYPVTSPHYGQGKPNDQTNAEPHKILGDSRVREAIFKSLDRNKFFTDIANGAGRVADAPVHSIFQPNGAYQGPQPLPTFDRTAAGALLDAAGWGGPRTTVGGVTNIRTALNHPYKDLANIPNNDPELQVNDGDPLTIEYLYATGNETYGQQVQDDLRTVGIAVTQVAGDNSLIVAPRIFNARSYDMGQISYCNNDEPQFGVRRQYHSDQLLVTNAFTNASGYKSLMMDNLWLAASKAPDVPTYQRKFLEIQRLALGLDTPAAGAFPALTAGTLEIAQKIPMVQLLESAGTRGTRSACTGFNNNNTGLYVEAASCKR